MNRILNTAKSKFVARAAAVAAVAAVIVIGLTMTYAAPSGNASKNIVVTLTDPHPTGYTKITLGTDLPKTVINAREWISSDETIATVATVGDTEHATVHGVKAGVVAIAVGNKGGVVMDQFYQIEDAAKITEYTIKDYGEIKLSAGGTDSANAYVDRTPLSAVIEWSLVGGDGGVSVTTVGGITSTAGTKGVSRIVGKFFDKWGVPQEIYLSVVVANEKSTADIAVTVTKPNSYTELAVGGVKNGVAYNGYDWMSADDAYATVAVQTDTTKGNITGVAPGVAAVAVGSKGGTVMNLTYQIVNNNAATGYAAYTLKTGGEIYAAKGSSNIDADDSVVTTGATRVGNPIVWTKLGGLDGFSITTAGVITAGSVDGTAHISGAFTDKWGVKHTILITVVVGSGGEERGLKTPNGGVDGYIPEVNPDDASESYSQIWKGSKENPTSNPTNAGSIWFSNILDTINAGNLSGVAIANVEAGYEGVFTIGTDKGGHPSIIYNKKPTAAEWEAASAASPVKHTTTLTFTFDGKSYDIKVTLLYDHSLILI
jgi:hypothetical protein